MLHVPRRGTVDSDLTGRPVSVWKSTIFAEWPVKSEWPVRSEYPDLEEVGGQSSRNVCFLVLFKLQSCKALQFW